MDSNSPGNQARSFPKPPLEKPRASLLPVNYGHSAAGQPATAQPSRAGGSQLDQQARALSAHF